MEVILKIVGWLTVILGGVVGSLFLFEGIFAAVNFLACLSVGIVQLGLARILSMTASYDDKILELQRAIARVGQVSKEPKEWKVKGGTWKEL